MILPSSDSTEPEEVFGAKLRPHRTIKNPFLPIGVHEARRGHEGAILLHRLFSSVQGLHNQKSTETQKVTTYQNAHT